MNPPVGYQEVRTGYPFKVARLKPGHFVIGVPGSMYLCPTCGWQRGVPHETPSADQVLKGKDFYCRGCGGQLGYMSDI